MSPAQQQAASLAWQHAHPLLMVLISTAITLIVVTLIVLIRWLVSQSAWRYHPDGASGFIKDEFVRWGAILVPYLALSIGFKVFVYDLHPEYNKPEIWMGFAVVAIAFRLFLRRLPFVKAMGRHIDAAKAQAKAEAKVTRAAR
ncbi:hypothetical protein MMA231_03203 [Asticcacaulis sp. MM231]|uniref:hypothetical protein n=1 Tax=Asticcacaulis sp. MM231 TaxID=3157666 RepID=UPI0032D56827